MYHGIVLDLEFVEPKYPESLKIFAKRKSTSEDWILFGVEVEDSEIQKTIKDIQKNMMKGKYYAHFYNDKELLVVFKDKVFNVSPHVSTWKPIIVYGRSLEIPEEQLDFWPNRFQDEKHYFKPEDFV